jgi:CheY-like chemotaxis protein
VKGHHGRLDVSSVPSKGTTLEILLPVTDVAVRPSTESSRKPVEGRGTILIVDDEEGVRTLTGKALRKLGYETMEATDGAEGIEVYRTNHDRIDLIILDMVMPKMSGPETFAELRRINADAQVLVASGYARNAAVSEMLDEGACGFLAKPFRIAELSLTIAQHLPQKPAGEEARRKSAAPSR